jgi:cobaltochelatase CobN
VSASGLWEDDRAVADAFLRHTGYAYGQELWGAPAEAGLREQLKDVAATWHSRSSEVFGLLDNDDMYMYLGGLSLAVQRLAGRAPEVLVADQRDGGVRMEPLRKMLGREMRMRYLNPKWIEGMKAENYAGAREMSDYVEYLWGWQATTPETVDATLWEQTYAVYVEDKYGLEIKAFMGENNPWAFQSLTARMLEATRKGYWDAPEEVRRTLAVEYAMNVLTKGVACCDHTCNNPQLNQLVMTILSLPGLVSPEVADQFRLAVETAAQKSLEDQVAERREWLDRLAASTPASASPPAAETEGENIRGLKMEPLERSTEDAAVGASGVKWFAGLFVLAVLALFFWGFRRNRA